MLVYFALGDAKVWRWGSKPTPGPNANGFASQWNIGLRKVLTVKTVLLSDHPILQSADPHLGDIVTFTGKGTSGDLYVPDTDGDHMGSYGIESIKLEIRMGSLSLKALPHTAMLHTRDGMYLSPCDALK